MAYKRHRQLWAKPSMVRSLCTVEPLIGIIKEILGFRQFSLRGEPAIAGEWGLVCLAFNLKRFHTLSLA
jgi:Transposase DDE domain